MENVILTFISSLLKLVTYSYLLASATFFSETFVHVLWPSVPTSYWLLLIDIKSILYEVDFCHLFQVFLSLVYNLATYFFFFLFKILYDQCFALWFWGFISCLVFIKSLSHSSFTFFFFFFNQKLANCPSTIC